MLVSVSSVRGNWQSSQTSLQRLNLCTTDSKMQCEKHAVGIKIRIQVMRDPIYEGALHKYVLCLGLNGRADS